MSGLVGAWKAAEWLMAGEVAVARLDGLEPGTMRQVEVDGREVLLIRHRDRVTALSARCTHYGAPLVEGVLHGGRITCPWHHAVFDASSGLSLEPPGCDGLRRFEARVVDGEIRVTIPDAPDADVDRVEPDFARAAPDNGKVIAIVGAGAAGSSAAETLRASGYTGRLVMIGREGRLPYDRTLLSKEVLQGSEPPAPIELRSHAFYAAIDVELWLGRAVHRLDPVARRIEMEDGLTLTYDACLLASGGRARTLPVAGAELAGVVTLRSRDDVERILARLPATRAAVVVGSSFIGMECAASLRSRGIEVTVVTPDEVPFARLFGDEIGRALHAIHAREGTHFRLGQTVQRFEGGGRLEAVVTDAGERLPAELAIVGVGIEPVTDYLEGVELEEDGSVRVDAAMRVRDGLFAAGDIAHFVVPQTGRETRIEHWRLACEQGRVAALAMQGREVAYAGVPFFWSAQHLALYYVGNAARSDTVIIDGAPGEGPFIAYYVEGDRVVAALGAERNAEMAAIQELMRIGRMPEAARLAQALEDGGAGFDAAAVLAQA